MQSPSDTFFSKFKVDPKFFFKGTFDTDASDSESEVEDITYKVERYDRKRKAWESVDRKAKEVIFNKTKKDARSRGKKSKTIRKKGRRIFPRINNRVTGPNVNLSQDATTIHNEIPEQILDKKTGLMKTYQSFGATTVICALTVKNGEYRKLCFLNTGPSTDSNVKSKAEALGYHLVQAETAHAEGEMIQYLKTHPQYIFQAMGCDKPHCQECVTLLGKFLKTKTLYTDNVVSDQVFPKYHMPHPLRDATGYKERPSLEEKWTVKKKVRKNPLFMNEVNLLDPPKK